MPDEITDDRASAWSTSVARRWTVALILVATVWTPIVFTVALRDVFALPKLVTLCFLVPAALAGPCVFLALHWPVRAPLRRPDAAAFTVAGLAVLATAVSPWPDHGLQGEPLQFQGLIPFLVYAAGYVLARTVFGDARSVRWLLSAVAVAGLVAGGYALIQQVRLDPIWHVLDKGRVFGTLGQANSLAAYLVIALPAAIGLIAGKARLGRVLGGASVAVMLGALAFTDSRGGYLGLTAAVLAMAVAVVALRRDVLLDSVRRAGTGRLAKLALLAGIAFVALAATPAVRQTVDRVVQRAASIGDLAEGSSQSHLDLWSVAVAMTVEHPLLGLGPDSFALAFPTYRDRILPPDRAALASRFRPESPHDVYLAISSGLGIPALLAYLALIAAALAAAIRAARGAWMPDWIAVALIGALAGHLVTDAFMTGELAGSWLFWVLLGASVSAGTRSAPAPRAAPSAGRAERA